MKDDIGFPQLDPSSYPSQVFWLGISFVALYILMSKLALPRVNDVLETRRAKKEGDLNKANEIKEEAIKIKDDYQKSLINARHTAAKTLSDMEKKISEKISASQTKFAEESRIRVLKAEEDIKKAKKAALVSIKDISADLATDMVYKLTNIEVSNDIAKKAVDSIKEKV